MNKRFEYLGNRMARNFRELISFPKWYFSSREFIPDNHFYKRHRIKKIQKNNRFDIFVETGSFYGQMIGAVQDIFDQVISIEIYQPLFELNDNYYKHSNKVKIYSGDSSKVLPNVVNNFRNKSILFWLDGHYSGIGTGLGSDVSPIINELKIIFDINPYKLCIIIDDYRLFTGNDGYPSKKDVLDLLEIYGPNYLFYEDNDALVILSKKNDKYLS
jgi:hypothetical protein